MPVQHHSKLNITVTVESVRRAASAAMQCGKRALCSADVNSLDDRYFDLSWSPILLLLF